MHETIKQRRILESCSLTVGKRTLTWKIFYKFSAQGADELQNADS